MLTAGALSLLASRWLFAAAPLPAASSRWCSLPAGCLPCRSLLPCPLSTVFCGAPRPAASLPLRRPCQQLFPMALCHSAAILFAMALPASSSAAALRLAAVPRRPAQQKLRHGALASNKPHPAEKSTPVWLPIWCTWAGFANSQLRCATFQSTYSYKCTSSLLPPWSRCSDRRKSIGPSAPIANATSVSPPNEAVAWPVAQVSDR